MFLNAKGQSTAEYAIVIGLVVAVAAGILQIALKGGMAQKNKQAVNYMLKAGNDNAVFNGEGADEDVKLYTQELSKTQVDAATYEDKKIMEKGGLERAKQVQETETNAVTIETIKEANDN
jgi:hypothetical protein